MESVSFVVIIAFLYYSVFFAFASAHIAQTKGRSAFSWLILGALFGVFALLAIGLCDPKDAELRQREVAREQKALMKKQYEEWQKEKREIRQRRWGWITVLWREFIGKKTA